MITPKEKSVIPSDLPKEKEYIIGFLDIAGFHKRIALRLSSPALFQFMQDFYTEAERSIKKRGGKIIKFIGDAILTLFSPGELDNPVEALAGIQKELTGWVQERFDGARLFLKAHVGPLTIGEIKTEDFSGLDIFGLAVNETALLPNDDFVLSETFQTRFGPASEE